MERQLNNTSYPIPFPMFQTGTNTPATGKTVTLTRRKQGGSFAAIGGAVAEVANGFYEFIQSVVDVDTLGSLMLYATATGCDPLLFEVDIVSHNPFTDIALMKAKTDLIGASSTVQVRSPLTDSGEMEITLGDDYFAADGRSFDFPFSGMPSFVGGSCRLCFGNSFGSSIGNAITGTILSATSVRFEPTSAQTAILKGATNFEIEVTLSNGHIITPIRLEDGTVAIAKRVA